MISSTPSSSYVAPTLVCLPDLDAQPVDSAQATQRKQWLFFAAAVLLVSVPVFIQAPLVRSLPWVSLCSTVGWLGLAWRFQADRKTQLWGDLLVGFTWTWLAGSLYWGWLRWEPLYHLPVEAIGLPFVIWGMARQQDGQRQNQVGNFFYLGSLLGTVVTDIYFYLVDLIPHWRTLMQVSESSARPIFQSAIAQIQTPWGIAWAIILASLLLVLSLLPLASPKLHWWAFSGAVVSTILVDGLFWVAACLA